MTIENENIFKWKFFKEQKFTIDLFWRSKATYNIFFEHTDDKWFSIIYSELKRDITIVKRQNVSHWNRWCILNTQWIFFLETIEFFFYGVSLNRWRRSCILESRSFSYLKNNMLKKRLFVFREILTKIWLKFTVSFI